MPLDGTALLPAALLLAISEGIAAEAEFPEV
jgi:hypothetical protein